MLSPNLVAQFVQMEMQGYSEVSMIEALAAFLRHKSDLEEHEGKACMFIGRAEQLEQLHQEWKQEELGKLSEGG